MDRRSLWLAQAVRAVRRRMQGEGGFTLIELLVVIVIIPAVIGAVTLAIITVLQQRTTVGNRLSDSADSQFTSALYVRDVQSAGMATTSVSKACGSGTSFLLGLASADLKTVVSYWVKTSGTPPTSDLVRNICSNGVLSPPAGSMSVGGVSAAPTLTCGGGTCPASWTSGWVSTAGVSDISLHVTQSAGATDLQPLAYTLLAVPRSWTPQSGGQPAGGSPIPPLFLLGTGSGVLTFGNNDTLTVDGTIYVNSSASGAVSLGNNTTVNSTTNSLVVNCSPPAPGNCPSGVVTGGSQSSTTATATTTAVPDPLASLPTPAPPTGSGSCTSLTGSTVTCTPGIYTTAPVFATNGQTITFQPGNYLFEGTTPLTVAKQQQTVVFGSGIYIFNGGIDLSQSNNANISSGSGGVMFYIGDVTAPGNTGNNTGQVKFQANNTSLTLSPLTSGTYAGIVMFQGRLDPQTLYINGNNSTVNTINGIVYAPDAQVVLNGNSGGIIVGGILSQTLNLPGNNATIGLGP